MTLLFSAGGAFAGPVSGDDASAAGAAPLASPALSAPALGETLTATGTTAGAAPAQADAASPSAVAAEIIKEVQAGAGTAEAARPVPRPTVTTSPAASTSPRAEDDPLREWGKAAVAWVKQTVPWLREDEEDDRRPQSTGPGQADWNESPLEPGKAGRSSGTGNAQAMNTAPHDPGKSVGYGAAPRVAAYDPPPNLIRELIDTVRTVLEHPMTWLVGALVVIGAVAVKKLDRRPTK